MFATFENNLGNESSDVNNNINEYNNNNNNKNNSVNLNNATNKSNNIIINANSKTPKKTQIRIHKKANKNLINNIKPQLTDYQGPEFDEITSMENQYNIYINDLKMKLSEAKNERRKKEEEAILIQHRLTLLKNKEQIKLLEYEREKEQIGKILNNRIQAQKNLKRKMQERNYFKNSIGQWGKSPSLSTSIKRNKTSTSFFNGYKKNKNMNNSHKDFYRLKKYKNFTIEQNNDNIKDNINFNFNNVSKSIDLNNIDLNMLKNLSKSTTNDKQLFKKQIIEKLKQDEEEKKRIEDEIAKIEEEENKLLNKF